MIHDPKIEARLLVACIEEPHVLDRLEQLEIDDFLIWKHKIVFEAIRNVQAAHVPISVISIDSELHRRDAVRESATAEAAGIDFLLKLIDSVQPYGDDIDTALVDEQHLRVLRQNRTQTDAKVVEEILADVVPLAPASPPRIKPGEWSNMPTRVRSEHVARMHLAARALSYHNTYIDDVLRGILPHDLVLIGAPTGLGKTDLALSIAMKNALSERHVAYFALEAEENELELRTKFSWLASEMLRRQWPDRNEFNYTDWIVGRCEHIVRELYADCERWFENNLGGLWTFYRGERFTQKELQAEILKIHKVVDLIVIDHLHYVDFEDGDNESQGLGDTMKTIRDVSLRIGKPVVLVAHLRKKDERLKKIVPTIDDFHGSSNITKICTQAITIERAHKVQAPKYWLSPTYISVLKDRRAGAQPYVALQFFDRRVRTYEDDYVLGRAIKGNTDWEPLKPGDQPSWARGHRQLELEFV